MVTVISGTNRPQSKTKLIARSCFEMLVDNGVETKWLDLQELNIPLLTAEMYQTDGQHPLIADLQDKFLIPSDIWLIISPEYNGSFPGVLKILIDAVSVRRYKETFSGKKAALIGVASGRAGNFRGMEHLTGILNYLNVLVMPNKLPVSTVEKTLESDGSLTPSLREVLKTFVAEVVDFHRIYNKVDVPH